MTFSIRPAGVEDAPRLARLINELGWFQHYFEGVSPAAAQARIQQQLDRCLADDSHSVYVAETATGELAGYVSVHWLPYLFMPGPEGYVSELFLREQTRGQGLGTRLLEVVEEEAHRRGCTRLSLINVRSRESYQRGFYGRRGWEERGDAVNFVLRFR